jgi:hypothetical protein
VSRPRAGSAGSASSNGSAPAGWASSTPPLVGDPDASVRRAAVFASSFRPIVPQLATLGRVLGSDRDVGVRLAVLRLLGDNLSVARASALVDAAASRDPAEDVRAEARRLQSAG